MDEELNESDNESLSPTLDKDESDSSSDEDLNEPLSNLLTWAKRYVQKKFQMYKNHSSSNKN